MAGLLSLVFLVACYMTPTIVAANRHDAEGKSYRHPNMAGIAVVNVFLGWTLVGWVVALAWALQSAPVPHPVAVPSSRPTLDAELARLFELHELGALTDEEYAAAKAKLIG